MQYLNRQRVLEMIPLVVDDEIHPEDVRAFMDYIQNDEELKCRFESQKRTKKLIQDRCKRTKAPNSLKLKIQQLLDEEDRQTEKKASEASEGGDDAFPFTVPSAENRIRGTGHSAFNS